MARLGELGLTLGDVDLGSLEAESDTRLRDYFVRTEYVERLLESRRRLFLGRKGSGKSAVFTQLGNLLADQGHPGAVVVQLTPDQYAWDALRTYEEQGLMPDQAHANAWKFTLALQAAAALVNTKPELAGDEAREAFGRLEKFVGDNYGVSPTLSAAAGSLLSGLSKLNLSAFGFGVGIERGDRSAAPITPAITTAVLEAVSVASRSVTLVVALDRLDDSWDGSERSKSLLIGLLKAARELNGLLGEGDDPHGLHVLTFLRTDIYDGLRFDDKDKHRETERRIQWDVDELREMLQARLPALATVDEIFELGEMRSRVTPFNYVVRRTYLRPREVLQFVGLCIDSAESTATEIAKADIYEAEVTYSAWKVEDLAQEYSRIYPRLEEALDVLRQERHRYRSMEELGALAARKLTELGSTLPADDVLEMLFESSAIGIRPRDSGTVRYRADDLRLSRASSGTVYTHPSVRKGLNIIEAREPTEEEDP